MDASAGERAPRRADWLRLLAPDPERLEFTTRLALICALTTLVTEIYQTPDGALTAYVAFFLNKPERVLSLILSVAFTVVITVALGLIFLVAKFAIDDAMWRVIAMALLSFGLLFLASASQLRPIGAIVALIVCYGLDLLGRLQLGELATRLLLYVWLFVGIPAGVSILVNLLFAPAPRRTVERTIAGRLRLCAAVLHGAHEVTRRELRDRVCEGMGSLFEQLKFAGVEKSVPARALSALRQASLSTFALMTAVDELATSGERELPGTVRQQLASTLEEIAHSVQGGKYPGQVSLELTASGAPSPLARELLATMRDALRRFADPEAAAQGPTEKKPGFFVADAFTNPEHVHYALKTTAAALFCYVLYSLLDWPGIHTCFLTVYIVAQMTAAESVEKLSLRLIGCLLGAAAGLAATVYLIPHLTSIGGLMITVLLGAWAAAYLAAGSARISYAGFQLAFAFFLCVIQGSGPEFDLSIGRDRIIGIIIGNLVAYFTFAYVWPVSISRRIDPALAATFGRLAQMGGAREPAEHRLLGSEVQGALKETETDIELAGYEPVSIRRSAAWLATREAVVREGQALGSLLLLSNDTRELSRIAAVGRLERLAAGLARPMESEQMPPLGMPAAHGWQTLPARIDRRLRVLEAIVTSGGELQGSTHAQA